MRNIQSVLETQPATFEYVSDVSSEIEIRCDLWSSLREFKVFLSHWINEKFCDINVGEIAEKAEYHSKIVQRCENRGLKDSTAVQELKMVVAQLKEEIPVVQALGNKKLKPVHWKEIKDVMNTTVNLETRDFSLSTLIELDASKYSEEINNISITASQEYSIEKQLEQIKKQWEKRGFITKQFTKEIGRDPVIIITDADNLLIDLDESLTTLNTIIGSRYAKRLLESALQVKQQFDMMWQISYEWLHCQRNWVYLDSIFSSHDIRTHLKKETADFEIMDKQWKLLMRMMQSKNVLIHYTNADHFEKLQKLNKSMDKIKKELQHYLETKRRDFPRFYFLSDGELLPMMSNFTNISAVESILPKCFESIVKLELGQSKTQCEIIGIISPEGEKVPIKTIRTYGDENIVVWLKNVEVQMIDALRKSIKTGYGDYYQKEEDRKIWVLSHSSQVVSCVSQLAWTESCEYAIKELNDEETSLIDLLQQSKSQIIQLTEAIHGPITPIQRNILVALITTDVHWRDIAERLAINNVGNVQDFSWQMQLRYYFEERQDFEEVVIRQINAEFSYGYEYIGASTRLVVTPLTERCFLTITSALQIHLGAASSGPAGTGKTETVKDLAKALAIQCMQYNCSDQLEIKIILRLFTGLILQGAWCCFDEFNKIDIEVLSVIAQQLLQIRDSLRSGKAEIFFNDIDLKLKQSIGIFITMNPDYNSQTQLPDNLKNSFRPISINLSRLPTNCRNFVNLPRFQKSKIFISKINPALQICLPTIITAGSL